MSPLDIPARVTSKGQVTVPKAIRDALHLKDGDSVMFRLRNGEAVLKPVPNFLDLAGTVEVPPEWRGASWEDIRDHARRVRARWRFS